MSSKNFYGLTGDVTVDGGILNVGNAQLYANTETSNVGIGTTNAEFKLDVRGDANVQNLYATFLHGDGSNIENIVSSQWEGSPGDPIYYASNVGIANTSPITKTLQVGSNLYVEDAGSNVLHVTGNVYADYFVGDGSQLTGIAASLDQIVDQGNTVSNTIQIEAGQDATSNVGLVTWEGVSISVSNANPTGEYQFGVGSNLLVNVYSSNVLTVGGNVFAQKMTLGSVTVTPAYNLQQITETGPTTNQTLVLSNVTTGLTADANVVVNGNVTAGSVITSGNVNAGNVVTSSNIEVGGDLSVTGNVYIDDMRVAEVASNLVTYDSTTGELMDSGGLFSNKLAVVSEQPPIALTGASTVVTNHGTYTIEASSTSDDSTIQNLFDKDEQTVWRTDNDPLNLKYNSLDGSYAGSASLVTGIDGEWVKITMPYKTILRHVKIESTNRSIKNVTLVGLNADGLTWTSLKTVDNLNEETSTIIVNATSHHKTYGLIVRATNVGSSQAEIGDLRLFTESFSIDGGKVEMASSAVMGGETTMDQHGPHSRGEAKLKKYPEIVFDASKLDGNDSTNTYTQAGYTVSASSYKNQEAILRSKGLTGPQGYTMSTGYPDLLTDNGGVNGLSGMKSTAPGVNTGRSNSDVIPAGSNPKTSGTLTPTGSRFYWSDLGQDIFDEWGRWYIYNPADQTASHIQFGTLNGPTGTVFTEIQYHVGKTFTIKHGWVARGIFKLDVECEDPTFSFSIGMYGNMGSDSTTENLDKMEQAPWGTLHYNFNRTNSGSAINTDPFYTYLIPKQRSFNDDIVLSGTNFTSKLNTVTSGSAGDDLAIWFDTLQVGATMYFVKGASGNITTSSMVNWVANDISGEANPWKVFDEITPKSSWASKSGTYYDGTSPANSYTGTTHQLGPGAVYGEWLKLKLSHSIKLTKFILYADDINEAPKSYKIYGSVTGSSWTELKDVSNETPSISGNSHEITDTEGYRYIAVVVTQVNTDQDNVRIGEIKLYGYEYFGAGDTSVDTTFTSIMNTPQTTDAHVYVDGSLGETFTNRVVGPTVSNTHTTYVSAEKYWELSGNVESNVTVEANTFLEGDAPHSVSVWFNSSNLEANVSNTCVFSVSDQEKLDSVNLDLQSNTWHNLTYAYQGEGGSRVTYLDGRKVAEDQAEDTFGEYPPFAMTGYSQGGYVVSTSSFNAPNYPPWEAFDDDITDLNNVWHTPGADYSGTDQVYNGSDNFQLSSNTDFGHWIKIEMPHKLIVSHLGLRARIDGYESQAPEDFQICGSNDDVNWDILADINGASPQDDGSSYYVVNSNKGYRYHAIVCSKSVNATVVVIQNLKFYGHRENDLVRLPDPTNVLKYPHIAMTGPAQRGYVVTETSAFVGTEAYKGYNAFDEKTGDSNSNFHWISHNSYDNDGNLSNTATILDVTTVPVSGSGTEVVEGEWIQVELPHKLLLSDIAMERQYTPGNDQYGQKRAPRDGALLGSNDGTSWKTIHKFTGLNATDWPANTLTKFNGTTRFGTISTSSPNYVAYKYFRLVVQKTNPDQVASSNAVHATIREIQLYGTEENSSIPIQIGGGNIDKVANFRVYDKFVGEDQALEIWDAQKDEFGRAKSSMTLHKGRLGIGTDEPQGRLAVLDEPHNLEEFPPRAMTDYKNYFEGHGEFCVSASSSINGWRPWMAFNHIVGNEGYHSSSSGDSYTNGIYDGTNSLGGYSGAWISLELPYKIRIDTFKIAARVGWPHRGPVTGVLLASNDNVHWDKLHEWSSVTFTDYQYTNFKVNNTDKYSHFAIVATALDLGNSNSNSLQISEWRLFGTREQGQSVLHDGQLTLTKSLNVPRIGPALDADDTPRRDRLVVEYNTSTNPTFEGAVRDTSGRGNDIVMYGNAKYDVSEKAFRLDGTTGTYMSGTQNLGTGTPAHTITGWFKQVVSLSNWTYVMFIGTSANGQQSGMLVSSTGQIVFDIYNTRIDTTVDVIDGTWYHFAGVFKGGTSTWDNASTDLYINGQLEGSAAPDSGTQYSFNLTGNGIRFGTSTSSPFRYFNGSISNFKLYDTALTAEEVKRLYDMGRCDEGHHVVNFSKTRVGIGLGDGEAPRGVLDVRGDLYLSGNIIRNTSSAKSGGVWLPTYQFEVGTSTFVEDQRRGYYHIINNVLTAVYRARVVSNSGAGTLRPSLPGGHKVAGVVSGSTVAIGWWARNSDFGTVNVGPYMLSDTTNGYIQPFHPGQTNNQVRLDGSSLEADTYWTMFLSYPVE
jgi:cytoskeletal protein CcmA (bactofilin family)